MKLIVGLGNPGTQYHNTRHNVGYFMVEKLRNEWGFPDWTDSRFKGVVSEGIEGGEKVILLKPTTYMNLSGESVASLVHFYKLNPETDILILVDDIDIEFSKVRYRAMGSSGGQNGIKSITEHLSTDVYSRIKIGVGRDDRYSVSDWVLSRFQKEELQELESTIFPIVLSKIHEFFP